MGYYEPQWSAEEQTMLDLMQLAGWNVYADITKDCTRISLKTDQMTAGFQFTADTEYEAIRKTFNYWTNLNA